MNDIAQPDPSRLEVRHQKAIWGQSPGWQAELHLKFGVAAPFTQTRLLERRHRGPLVIQRPFHPEGDPCHVYIVHPPGGVVGGDELHIDVDVAPRAHALITTPAATKFYRCDQRKSSQTQELRAPGATLEWLPQENIFYRGAEVRTATRVHLDAASQFIGWEIACLGLPARGEKFDAGSLKLDLELWRAGGPEKSSVPFFLDRLRIAGGAAARTAAWGLAGHEAIGTLLATPATAAYVESIRGLIADQPFAAVTLVDGVLVLRALAAQAHEIRHLFIAAWQHLRPAIVGRAAANPRIWAT
jgi:urease accessory protein